jgi:predicted nucleic acid-binding protein
VSGLTLDTGALVAFERADRKVIALLRSALENRLEICIPTAVVAQVWRDGRRQARLSRLLRDHRVLVEPLEDQRSRAVGQLLGATHTTDIVDAAVVLCAKARGHAVATSDRGDLRRLAPALRLIPV